MKKAHKIAFSLIMAAICGALSAVFLFPYMISNFKSWVYLIGGVVAAVVLYFACYNVLPPSAKED